MLRIRNLKVEKQGRAICSVPALTVDRDERVAVFGPNGSGKTTLLRVLGGLERELAGECQIEAPLRQRVYVHQAPYLFRGSVAFNVGYGLAARGVPRQEQDEVVQHWLKLLGVDHLARRQPHGLSGGERRRVALARALAIGADLLLLDEPFAELDSDGIAAVCRALEELPATTIVLASPTPLPGGFSARTWQFPTA